MHLDNQTKFTMPIELTMKTLDPHVSPRPGARQQTGRLAIAALISFATGLSACSDRPEVGTIGYVNGFVGAVTGDEPRSVLVARDILSAGGTAADAAVATALALTVTYPLSASIGGGGVCIVHDHAAKMTETLEFYPGQTKGSATAHPTAVPGLPRGLFALHAKYGHLRWERLVTPAENLARFGDTTSRSLADALAAEGAGLGLDAEARRVFVSADGFTLGEGVTIKQMDLAETLSRLRIRGPGDFYAGALANDLVTAVAAVGGSLTTEDLHDYMPRWVATTEASFGTAAAHFAPAPADGATAAAMWSAMKGMDEKQPQVPANTSAPIAPAAGVSATGFAVVDREGSAVACTLTMNAPFGSRRVASGTGVLLALPPGNAPYPTPMLVVKRNVNEVTYAATATGNASAAASLTRVASQAVLQGQSLAQAVMASAPGRVNAIACLEGLPPFPKSCHVVTDPKGFGMALVINDGEP
ncbi:MAG: gamma-glutamyltransferase [Alphaproteobacteria bacterium]|nr:gamma-glutamyltransferase [Alphaproteobacteria bacterium]